MSPLFEKAVPYILGIIVNDETIKTFPKEFVAESAKWVKSWFLRPEDPKTTTRLTNPENSPDYKKPIIEDKLEYLLQNPVFTRELEEKLREYDTHKTRRKNILNGSNLDIQGNYQIGDSGTPSADAYDEKNIVNNSTIKIVGDFHLGDNNK